MTCFNGNEPISVHEENLILHIDISDKRCWPEDLQDLSVKSLVRYENTEISESTVLNYGAQAKDFGFATTYDETYEIEYKNDRLVLKPVGGYIQDGTSVPGYDVIPVLCNDDCTSGNYFNLQGGYISNFFKLDGYKYTILPSRFINGVSLETVVNVDLSRHTDDFNDGILLYMGTRSEEKNYEVGVSTDQVIDNNFALRILSDGKVSVRTLLEGDVVDDKIFAGKVTNGWNVINLTFKPYAPITDPDMIDCTKTRKGTLELFINGKWSGEFKDFNEFHFSGTPDQPGVAYSLTWGGGTFGLRHAWNNEVYTPISGVVEKVFGGSFNGGIQKLRIYETPLSIDQIRQNYNSEADSHGLDRI